MGTLILQRDLRLLYFRYNLNGRGVQFSDDL